MSRVRVLLVEDNAGDALLVREYLEEANLEGYFVQHVERLEAAIQHFVEPWDVVLLDLSLPDAHGLDTVRKLLDASPDIPIVVMSGLNDQDIALKAVKEGAQDYLVKGQVEAVGLSKALTYAIERAKSQRLLQEARAKTEALRVSERHLRSINEAQKRFVSDAAHELRAPLTAIMGNLELILRFPNMPATDQHQALIEAEQEARRMSRLVSDLLTLARGDGGIKLRQEQVSLNDILQRAFNDAHHMAKKDHTLELELCPEVEAVGDRDYLKQLFMILLDNAIKYTPSGSIRLSLNRKPDYAEIRVADSGVGIGEEDLPKVFERFYRADKSRTPSQDPGGSGLGLSIAQWIVSAHKGRIYVQSQLGKGSQFIVELPVDTPLPLGQ